MPNVSARMTHTPCLFSVVSLLQFFFCVRIDIRHRHNNLCPHEKYNLESRDLLQFVLVGVVEEMKS